MTFIIDMASGQQYQGESLCAKPRELNTGKESCNERRLDCPDTQLALVEVSTTGEQAGIVPAGLDMRKLLESLD